MTRTIEVEGGYHLIVKKVKDLKKGEWFTLKPIVFPKYSQVYTRDEYDRSTKKYVCIPHNDIWGGCREIKGDREVYTDFFY